MKKLSTLLLLLFCFTSAFAAHIVGGEMIYEYIGPGAASDTKKYRITLILFRDENCRNCAAMPANVFIGIFNNDTRAQFPAASQPYDVRRGREGDVATVDFPECIQNPPNLHYFFAEYTFEVELPNNASGYTAAYQTCCRVNSMTNVFNSSGGGGTGSTYSAIIPGTKTVPLTEINSSPRFFKGISIICYNKPFKLNFSATDVDDDSLVYSFCDAYNGGAATNASNINPSPPTGALPPQYSSVPYINNYSGTTPLGSSVTINSATGIISGIAPPIGDYVISVCINEYRNGVLIGYHRKDFIINVANCDFAGAEPACSSCSVNSSSAVTFYTSCDGFTTTFANLNRSNLNRTFFWDFGVPGRTDDTSTLSVPTFTYPDTGVYTLKLVVNRGEACSDSSTTQVRIFPGFFTGFTFAGICVNKPTRFTDTSRTVYGTINSWRWNFGDNNSFSDTSRLQNPVYTYSDLGVKRVQLIVTNSKGCVDTINKDVPIIDKPPITLAFRDTLICRGDAVQLMASSNGGTFTWTPNSNINNTTSGTPTVNPPATTIYKVELDDNGCKNTDSVRVRVVNFVTLQARSDTTICQTDQVQLNAVTDGLRFQWSPTATLNNPNIINPTARPLSTTTYQITSTTGSCNAKDDVTVNVIPYPVANAGMDTIICFGTQAQLNGSITASSFTWSPANTLSNANTLSPVATPVGTTTYILTVRDNLGCPKPGRDSVIVTVLPKINAFAGNDTAVVVGQPVQFLATGGISYKWIPGTSLNNPNIPNPIGIYTGEFDSIQYKILVSNAAGCIDSALLNVRIFKTDPRVFVPTAFTPNGDGKNDVVRPIAVGITKIEYFRVYNRWGQLVFSTTTNGRGWDGKIKGKDQGNNTFVWMVKAIDFTGKVFFAKGTVTLIR
jgi:gliding motility-associated-like protein